MKIKNNYHSFLSWIKYKLKLRYVDYMYIETSSKCNLLCTYCYRQGYDYSSKNINMDFEVFRKIISEFPYMKLKKPALFLHGNGEPTLNPRLTDMVRLAKESGKFATINFVSNLLAVRKEKYDEYFNAGLTQLYVSLDTLDKKKLESGRKGTDFEKFIDSFNYIADKYSDRMCVITVLSNNNKDEIFDLHNFIKEHGITKWNIQLLNKRDGSFDISDEDVNALSNELMSKKSDMVLQFEKKVLFKCRQPYNTIVFNSQGFMTPCCNMMDSDRINFGNVKSAHICDLFSSDEFNAFRDIFSGQRPDVCKHCPYY